MNPLLLPVVTVLDTVYCRRIRLRSQLPAHIRVLDRAIVPHQAQRKAVGLPVQHALVQVADKLALVPGTIARRKQEGTAVFLRAVVGKEIVIVSQRIA